MNNTNPLLYYNKAVHGRENRGHKIKVKEKHVDGRKQLRKAYSSTRSYAIKDTVPRLVARTNELTNFAMASTTNCDSDSECVKKMGRTI